MVVIPIKALSQNVVIYCQYKFKKSEKQKHKIQQQMEESHNLCRLYSKYTGYTEVTTMVLSHFLLFCLVLFWIAFQLHNL